MAYGNTFLLKAAILQSSAKKTLEIFYFIVRKSTFHLKAGRVVAINPDGVMHKTWQVAL